MAGNRNAIGDDFLDAGRVGQPLLDLGGRDVLALPAVGVADPVDEIDIAFAVLLHQIAGAEPAVAAHEDVAQDLLLGRRLVGIAGEGVANVVADHAQGLADLAGFRQLAQTVRSANRLLGVHVEPDQPEIDLLFQEARNPADRARLAVEIEHRDIALGRAVEFQDVRHGEPLLEIGPDIRPQAVAEGQPQLVGPLALGFRAVDQIAAQLADIDEQRRARGLHIRPEIRRREPLAQHQLAAVQQGGPDPDQSAGRVIERQDVEGDVLFGRGGRAGEGAHIGAGPGMGDLGRLGQAGRARGVDVQGRVAVGQA